MNRAKVAIVAAELWAGGIVYTHNLVRALAQLPDDERPQMTLLYEQNAEPFRELFSLVETHTVYQPMFAQRRNKLESLLANHGWRAALSADPALRKGLNTHGGAVTHRGVCEATGLAFTDPADAIA